MIAALGRATRGRVERLLAGAGGHRLVAGVTENHPQRAQDLLLVVADEHARLRRSRTPLTG